jgi:hypothetical protein
VRDILGNAGFSVNYTNVTVDCFRDLQKWTEGVIYLKLLVSGFICGRWEGWMEWALFRCTESEGFFSAI